MTAESASCKRSGAAIAVACSLFFGCEGTPTEPHETTLPAGRWTGGGACLAVATTVSDLAVGCGHGQFQTPTLRRDGTFDVEGTYRIEAGPISQNPAPPAHFSGSLRDSVLTLTVVPSLSTLPPASYSLRPASSGGCPIPCL